MGARAPDERGGGGRGAEGAGEDRKERECAEGRPTGGCEKGQPPTVSEPTPACLVHPWPLRERKKHTRKKSPQMKKGPKKARKRQKKRRKWHKKLPLFPRSPRLASRPLRREGVAKTLVESGGGKERAGDDGAGGRGRRRNRRLSSRDPRRGAGGEGEWRRDAQKGRWEQKQALRAVKRVGKGRGGRNASVGGETRGDAGPSLAVPPSLRF